MILKVQKNLLIDGRREYKLFQLLIKCPKCPPSHLKDRIIPSHIHPTNINI